jgi:hypothetical protein
MRVICGSKPTSLPAKFMTGNGSVRVSVSTPIHCKGPLVSKSNIKM